LEVVARFARSNARAQRATYYHWYWHCYCHWNWICYLYL